MSDFQLTYSTMFAPPRALHERLVLLRLLRVNIQVFTDTATMGSLPVLEL